MSRSRRKLDTSPIEYDEVVDSPSLKGMVSFLEVPPGELPRLSFPAPVIEIPSQLGKDIRGTPERGTPLSGQNLNTQQATNDINDERGTPEGGTPLSPLSQTPTRIDPVLSPQLSNLAAKRVRRAILAQDGHSLGEQALYEALWQHSQPYQNQKEIHIITVGYRQMAQLARLTVNNCKANIQSLIQKLAIEEASSFTHSQGRTYFVYSYTAVIQRRREAGLTHYTKTRGVAFVDPNTGQPLTKRTRNGDKEGTPEKGAPYLDHNERGIPKRDERGTPLPDDSGIPLSDTYLYRQKNRQNTQKTTTNVPTELVKKVRQIVNFMDDEAVGILWQQCRSRAADCTVEEVLHFTHMKASFFRNGKITNPTGFLLIAVPKCFEGTTLEEYRRQRAYQRQQEAEQARQAEQEVHQMRQQFEAMLTDPQASEADKQLARQILELK